MKYTQQGAKVDRAIQKDFDLLCEVIRQQVPDLVSVLLMGGFAKGEGSVKVVGEKVFPFNDYDLYFVTEKPKTEAEIVAVNEACNKALKKEGHPFFNFRFFYEFEKAFFVDLHHITVEKLAKAPPMMRYFELKKIGRVLWGKDVRRLIPNYRVAQICSYPEMIRFLFNRLTNLVLFFRPEFINRRWSKKSRETLTYYTSRAVLTVGNLLLMEVKDHQLTYKQALRRLKQNPRGRHDWFFDRHPDFLTDFENSYQWKLKPYSVDFDPVELWFNCREYLGTLLKRFLKKVTGREAKTWSQFAKLTTRHLPKSFYHPYLKHEIKKRFRIESDQLARLMSWGRKYLNWLYFIRVRQLTGRFHPSILSLYSAPDLQIFSSLPLIVFAIDEKGKVDRAMLDEAFYILAQAYPLEAGLPRQPKARWRKMSKIYSDIYISFFWQKLV